MLNANHVTVTATATNTNSALSLCVAAATAAAAAAAAGFNFVSIDTRKRTGCVAHTHLAALGSLPEYRVAPHRPLLKGQLFTSQSEQSSYSTSTRIK